MGTETSCEFQVPLAASVEIAISPGKILSVLGPSLHIWRIHQNTCPARSAD